MSPPRRPGRTESDRTPSDLRAALRVATAELHRRLDRVPAQRALLAPDLTLQRYAAILATHAAAYRRCEAMLAPVAGCLPSGVPPYWSRPPALRDDLAWLSTAMNDWIAAATEAFGVFLRAFAPVAASAPAGDFAAAGPNARAERERP